MTAEIRQFTATIPAGTAQASPVRVSLAMPPREVQGVEIRVPPGPSGVVGFALQNSGVTVIPYDSDPFIVTSGDAINWPLQNYITSGSWQLLGYNTGVFDHSVYVRFLLDLVAPAAGPAPGAALAQLDGLSSAGPSATAQLAALLDAGA